MIVMVDKRLICTRASLFLVARFARIDKFDKPGDRWMIEMVHADSDMRTYKNVKAKNLVPCDA